MHRSEPGKDGVAVSGAVREDNFCLIFHNQPEVVDKCPALHFGCFSRDQLQLLPRQWKGDVRIFSMCPLSNKVPAGLAMKKSHCIIPPLNSGFGLAGVWFHGTFYVIAVLRRKDFWNTALEKKLSEEGKTVVDFFEAIKDNLREQKRSTVDSSDGKAFVCYGWCYYLSWFNGCVHKRSFDKDIESGNCLPNGDLDWWGLNPKNKLVGFKLDVYKQFLTFVAYETGMWIQEHLPGTTELLPPTSDSCRHTPHFTSFALALDAQQLTHRDIHNQGFTNIINLCDAGAHYYLGLANYRLAGCGCCDSVGVEYDNGTICSIFSQDHDHFVDRKAGPDIGRRIAVLYYSHRLTQSFHGQEEQIELWGKVTRIRDKVLSRMREEKAWHPSELAAVKKQYNHLLSSCKDPKKVSSEEDCILLMREMADVKRKRDSRRKRICTSAKM